MFTIIISIIVCVVFAIFRVYKYTFSPDCIDYFMDSLLGLLIGLFIGGCVACALPMDTKIVTTTTRVESLQDNSSIEGSFFLGCGNINGTMSYVFYYESDGGYKMAKLNYYDVLVKYSNDKPFLEIIEEVITEDPINLFAIDVEFATNYIIHVPKGTIRQNYNLDAQ